MSFTPVISRSSTETFDYLSDFFARRSADGRYEYTDGCGNVCPEVARKLAEQLGLQRVPSAFQIRFRGCKGMLVTYPLADGCKVRRDSIEQSDPIAWYTWYTLYTRMV